MPDNKHDDHSNQSSSGRVRLIDDNVDEYYRTIDEEQLAIANFMRQIGQPTPNTPTIPDDTTCELRLRLIREELHELHDAIKDKSLPLIADALADLIYVVKGAAVAFGINLAPIFDEVHDSNMSKVPNGFRRADGKWEKSPGYRPANIAAVLNEQMD